MTAAPDASRAHPSSTRWRSTSAARADRDVPRFSSGLPLALSGATLLVWMRESGVDLGTIGLFALVARRTR